MEFNRLSALDAKFGLIGIFMLTVGAFHLSCPW